MNTIIVYLALFCLLVCIVVGVNFYIKYLKKSLNESRKENQVLRTNLNAANDRILRLSQLDVATNAAEVKANEKKSELNATPDASLAGRANKLF